MVICQYKAIIKISDRRIIEPKDNSYYYLLPIYYDFLSTESLHT